MKKINLAWVSISFVILTCIMTFPLIFNIFKYIPGFFSTDESYGVLWSSWIIKHSFLHHLSLSYTNFVAYPSGIDIYSSGYFSIIWLFWFHLLSILLPVIYAYNVHILLNLTLSGIFTYLLVYHVTKSRVGAFFSGVAFAYCPYQFARVWQHFSLTYNQWIPLILFAIILLMKSKGRKAFILLLISVLMTFSTDWTIMYFSFFVIVVFFLYWAIQSLMSGVFRDKLRRRENTSYLKRVSLAFLIVFLILSPQFIRLFQYKMKANKNVLPSAFNVYNRPFEDLFAQSARPLSYLLPSSSHPVFGQFTSSFVGNDFYGGSFTEHTLYLGFIPLILAFIAIKTWRRRKRACKESEDDFFLGYFTVLAIAAWLFSQPPWWQIGPVKIYMPSFFVYKILPMFRAYCRFGIVLMLAVSVLAGFGFKYYLERFKTFKMKAAVALLVLLGVLFEFFSWPPYKVIDVSRVPQVYSWLKQKGGDFVIAEYPLDARSPNELFKFYQITHEKKMINGRLPGTEAFLTQQPLVKLSSPETASRLKALGVHYVLVHPQGYLVSELADDKNEMEKIPFNPGLRFIATFPDERCKEGILCLMETGKIDVYEVSSDKAGVNK